MPHAPAAGFQPRFTDARGAEIDGATERRVKEQPRGVEPRLARRAAILSPMEPVRFAVPRGDVAAGAGLPR